jgi:UDP-2-acetamido-3-amino-2,3-dideoxy-glucuronate N-acetyltransferase
MEYSIMHKPKQIRKESYIAVVGGGYWGKNLIRNFHQLGVLKIVCDQDERTCRALMKEYPGIDTTPVLEDVLKNNDVQGVVVATPAALHYEIANKALLAGRHIFVEKPLSLNYRDGEKLVLLAHERKRTLFVGHILHYHPAVVKLKEMIRKGTIGRLQYIYSRRLSLGKIRREENILWSFAPHDISLILGLTGEEPSYVDAVGNNFLHARIPDVTMTNLKFPSGIGAHIFVSWLNPFKEQRLIVVGDRGMIVFDDTQPVNQKLVHYPHEIHWHNGTPVPEKAEGIPIDISDHWEEPLRSECQAFLDSMRTGVSPITSGEEGLRVLHILEICQRSLEEKEPTIPRAELSTPPVIPAVIPGGPIPDGVFVHPTAVIDNNVTIGKGTKIWHFSHILPHSEIGEKCTIGQNVVIGPDVTIGSNCKIQNNVSVYKGVILEEGVFCGPSMVFTNIYNPRAEISKMDQVRSTLVKRGATLGANCTIVCGNTIGRYAFIGAGAVVTEDVADYALVAGNPARHIGWVCECGERLDVKKACTVCGKKYRKAAKGLRVCSSF